MTEADAKRLYQATGIAPHPFNTVFQLMAERDLDRARHAVLVPDLMTCWLSGQLGTELTNASATGLLDTRVMRWAEQVAEPLSVRISMFPRLRAAAEVAAVPADGEGFAFVCTGTWALVGVELAAPVITEAARQAGFSNEAGVDGTTRFLRNVTGFWLLQECVREWGRVDLDELTRAVDSMAVAIRHAVRDAVRLSGRPARTVHVVGGGVANALFCQLVADACQRPVVAGPTEAACWGNTLIQARALGVAGRTLPELRSLVRRGVRLSDYEPAGGDQEWERADEIVLGRRS